MDKERQLNLDEYLDTAIAEAEAEYISEEQLIDAREALCNVASHAYGSIKGSIYRGYPAACRMAKPEGR